MCQKFVWNVHCKPNLLIKMLFSFKKIVFSFYWNLSKLIFFCSLEWFRTSAWVREIEGWIWTQEGCVSSWAAPRKGTTTAIAKQFLFTEIFTLIIDYIFCKEKYYNIKT